MAARLGWATCGVGPHRACDERRAGAAARTM